MQSGKGNSRQWILEFTPQLARRQDALTGWSGAAETITQVRLSFDTEAEAVAYAQREKIPFRLVEPRPARRNIRAYADNFSTERRFPWTH